MKTLIIGGGNIDSDFALAFMIENPHDFVIAADRGMEFLRKADRLPDWIVGDFDSAAPEALAWFESRGVPVRRFRPQKDSTDMEIAILMALERGSTQITILGATGTRMDHMLGSIKNLSLALRAGVPCSIVDAHNRIRLADKPLTLERREQYGKYVSLLAFGEPVTNLTLRGFFYPLDGYTMTCDDAIGISNQITEDEAQISFDGGRLLVIESRD
ncbi:thiamine diphosphokinase [Marvinbryantia formatexigens DSM 14469]|uniref:Thiamine diphosphokinase n=1 Tax=Marvinbryantia formatexigens DSM 14469 TaxID=478749 RepID=C6LGZ2_9FIRM|nr:thiamine diphosphokinase [Marvinbryantia formatexigens]EET60051.1 thiamine diphosphokinase [Marvinbryantia formatexigens DSM 14469]UWO23849.1 thiamine diphosphokinase [Marvinbryantia formatexigens DSM 14469]SDG50315.1 thiamine pyrophosphokinase [Marvinbryantia formatexigens]